MVKYLVLSIEYLDFVSIDHFYHFVAKAWWVKLTFIPFAHDLKWKMLLRAVWKGVLMKNINS